MLHLAGLSRKSCPALTRVGTANVLQTLKEVTVKDSGPPGWSCFYAYLISAQDPPPRSSPNWRNMKIVFSTLTQYSVLFYSWSFPPSSFPEPWTHKVAVALCSGLPQQWDNTQILTSVLIYLTLKRGKTEKGEEALSPVQPLIYTFAVSN